MFLTLFENQKSSLFFLKKQEVTLSNQPTLISKDQGKNYLSNNATYLDPLLLSDYDFITELLQVKIAKFDKTNVNNHFTFIKDSLTLISTKLNIIKEEDISSSSKEIDKSIEQSDRSVIDIDKRNSSEEYLDAENDIRTSSPSTVSDLLLSCEISEENLTEETSKLVSLNIQNKEVFDDHENVLEKLLNMNDTALPLNKKYSDCLLENSTKYLSGILYNGIEISAVSRSQQTVEIKYNIAESFAQKNGAKANLNKNMGEMKNKIEENQTSDRLKKQVKSFIVSTPKLIKKQRVSNRGDFCNFNITKADRFIAGSRQYKKNNNNENNKSRDVNNRCHVYIPRANFKNQNLNTRKWSNVTSTSPFSKENEFDIANMVIKFPKKGNSYIYPTREKGHDRNISKNIRNTYKYQPKRSLIGMRNLLSEKNKKPSMRNMESDTMSYIKAANDSAIKIVLKISELKKNVHLETKSCGDQSTSDSNESENFKFKASESSLFLNSEYKLFKEYNRSVRKIYGNENNSFISRPEFSNTTLKGSSVLLQTKSSASNIGVASNKETIFHEKNNSPSLVFFQKNEKSLLPSEFSQSEIVTLYTKTSEDENKSVDSPSVHQLKRSVSAEKKSGSNMSNDDGHQNSGTNKLDKTVNSVFRIDHRLPIDTNVTTDAIVNTLITMKRNKTKLKSTTSQEIINKNNYEINLDNVTGNEQNMLNDLINLKKSNVGMNIISAGSSFTSYTTTKRESSITNRETAVNINPSAELIDTRQYSSEQFIRKISNTSYAHNQSITDTSQQSENQKPIEMDFTSANEECYNSLCDDKTNYGVSTMASQVPLSEIELIGANSNKRLRIAPYESSKSCKKYTPYNTTESIIQRIKKLPFMGYECEWQRCTNDLWQFKLLNGRLFLILRLDCREDTFNKLECERRILSMGLHKYVIHRKRNNLSAYCVKFVGDSIRFYIASKKWDRIGQIPLLLSKCSSIVRLGTKWEKDMRNTKIRLGYELDNNGLLTMQVSNTTLNTLWFISMHLELQKDSYRTWSWPEVKDIRFRQVTGDRPFGRSDLIAKLRQINLDWDHVTNTLWTINDYLRHNKQGAKPKIMSHRCLHRSSMRKLQQIADCHKKLFGPRSKSPCQFSSIFLN